MNVQQLANLVTWSSVTALNTTVTPGISPEYNSLVITINTSSGTFSAGGLVFEFAGNAGDPFLPISGINVSTNAAQSSNFTLVTNTYTVLLFDLSGGLAPNFRIRLNPAITGTGTVTLGYSAAEHPGLINAQILGGGSGGTASSFGAVFPGTGTAAGAKDSSGNMAGLNLDASGFLKVNGSGVTQPVSGTVTANAGTNLNTSALALDTSVNGLLVSQGSATTGEKGPLAQAAVTTSAPTYTTGQTSPLSLDTSGNLRTSVSNTVTVSGTVATTPPANASTNLAQVAGSTVATAATGIAKVGLTDGSGTAITSTTGALDVNLKTSAATVTVSGTVTTTPPANASTNIAQFGGSAVVTGTGVSGAGIPRVTVASDSAITQGTAAATTAGWPVIHGNIVASTASWTSATAVNTTLVLNPIAGYPTIELSINTTSTMTGGVLTYEVTDAGGTWYPVQGVQVGTNSIIATTTLTNPQSVSYVFNVGGYTQFRARLSTVITGTGTASISAQGSAAEAIPLLVVQGTVGVSNFPATQPVSGTVTANIGTTNGLALDTSVNGLLVGQGSTTSGEKGPLAQGAVTTSAPTYTTAQTSPLSLDTSGNLRTSVGNTVTVSGTVTTTPPANASTNIAQVGGSAVVTAATGVQKVGIVGNAGAVFDAATAASVPANAIAVGYRAATAYPTAVTDGQLVGAMADKAGRQVAVLNSPRDLIGTATLDSSSSTAVSFIAAGAAGVFDDIISLIITNDSGTATIVSLSDNGAAGTVYKFALAANGGIVMNFPTPLPQGTAAAAWDVLNSAAVSLHYTAIYAKNK